MSFMLTERQMRDGTKSVTRRLGWEFLKVGDQIMACVKCQGLGKGGKIQRIGPIEVTEVRRERLEAMTKDWVGLGGQEPRIEATREGFPNMTNREFVAMFCLHMRCTPATVITRIAFKHI